MPRIRTIKPEFWSSPNHRGLDPWSRLLYIAMWNWADDYGRGMANAKELGGFAFREDEDIAPADVRRMLGEIQRAFGVVFYEVGGRPYYAIPSWEDHQKIDRRSQPKYPAPEDGTPWDPNPAGRTEHCPELGENRISEKPAEVSAEPVEHPAESAGVSALEIGTGEQGNRGNRSTSVLPVGQRTDRNARTRERAPAAQPENLLARRVIRAIPRYRAAPRWVRKHLAALARAALAAGYGREALTRYASDVIAEERFAPHQHIPELRDALRRLERDVHQGDACPCCGRDPDDCPTRRRRPPASAAADRPWTDDDRAAWERIVAHLGADPDELAREA